MPTEAFQLAAASPSYSTVLLNERTTFERRSSTFDGWRNAMLAGGWTDFDDVYAGVTVSIDVSKLPVRTHPGEEFEKLPGSIICNGPPAITVKSPAPAGIAKQWGYDPGVYTEPPCDSFAYGDTAEATFVAFLAALVSATGMRIPPAGITRDGDFAQITLLAQDPGPLANGPQISGWVGGRVWYGGYSMRSVTYRDYFLTAVAREGPGFTGGNDNAWEMLARVHREGDDVGGSPQRFDLGLDPAGDSAYNWRICVCPYQFAIWQDGHGDFGNRPGPMATVLSMPWVPDGFAGHRTFAFIATGNIRIIREDLAWGGYTWFDEGPWSSLPRARMTIPVLRTRASIVSPNTPDRITTTQGLLVTDNCYITAPRGSEFVIFNRICGKLWNCCTLSDNYAPSVIYSEMQGGRWVHISSQSWYPDYSSLPFATLYGVQKASVWWKVDAGDLVTPEAGSR